MKIQDAAKATSLSEKAIRYYESIGLIRPLRQENGYRDFSSKDIHKLKFLARSRGLGFSVDDCRQLLELYSDDRRASRDVKEIARAHLLSIETKIDELEQLRDTLNNLVDHCHGDNRPDCPILNDLAGQSRRSRVQN